MGPVSSSSSPEIGLLANGELRVGRVDGLPRPKPAGPAAGEIGAGATGGGGEGCLAGDPGGVVLASPAAPFDLSVEGGDGGGEGEVKSRLGVDALLGSAVSFSGAGSGMGVCSGESGRSSTSPSSTSSASSSCSGIDSSEKD